MIWYHKHEEIVTLTEALISMICLLPDFDPFVPFADKFQSHDVLTVDFVVFYFSMFEAK